MPLIRTVSAFLAGAALTLGIVGSPSVAPAADLPVKAVPVATPWVLDVHGGADLTFANTRVTGGGLYLYNRGFVTQTSVALSLDIYKNPNGFISGVSAFGGVWNENWSSPPVGGRSWQEMDWWVGFNVNFAKYWTFSAQTLQFEFPGGPTDYNYVFGLAFNDAAFFNWPMGFNPYVNMFYNAAGPSTVVLGKNGGVYRFDVGIAPSYSFMKTANIPLTITAPVWVTVGPTSYWNRADGTTNLCGPTTTSPCATSNMGYVAAGLQAKYSLETIIPKRLGSWYAKGGVTYYHLVNDALLAAQTPTGVNTAATFPTAHRDIGLVSGGLGFTF